MIAVTGKAAEFAERIESIKNGLGVQDQPLSELEQMDFIALSTFFNTSKEMRQYLRAYLKLLEMSLLINDFTPLKSGLTQAFESIKKAEESPRGFSIIETHEEGAEDDQ